MNVTLHLPHWLVSPWFLWPLIIVLVVAVVVLGKIVLDMSRAWDNF